MACAPNISLAMDSDPTHQQLTILDQNSQLTSQLHRAQQEMAKVKSKNKDLQASLCSLQEQLGMYKEYIEHGAHERNELMQQIHDLQMLPTLLDLQSKYDGLLAKHEAMLHKVQKKLDLYKKFTGVAANEKETFTQHMNNLQQENNNLRTALDVRQKNGYPLLSWQLATHTACMLIGGCITWFAKKFLLRFF